eukprot:CAMPEP_0197642622 /NCGR_PEP_ID=MMETSP1338-20131121/16227_1 /TAXON_ID=43686 ORGANISM="Pelagodinium beii, Strain RCC1491" /NCGR_SAMPLE_ID=MMETSP1338 /ASSEMBLY_ACC=CAM_ASM_000754 /LENGTH=289 /DNA_ID=CAMNT_0043215765 /DNA_START=57 /DNA_END=926 /DNA_ORIENTATION=+
MASARLSMARFERKSRTRLPVLLLGAAAVSMPLLVGQGGQLSAYTPPAPQKPNRGQIHNKNNLYSHVEELEEPEPEEEAPAKTPMPEERLPYTLNIVANIPEKRMEEDSAGRKFIESKLTHALEHFQESIRSIDVTLTYSEGFHKMHLKPDKVSETVIAEDDGEGLLAEVATMTEHHPGQGERTLAPYIFKAYVSMKDGHKLVFDKPEKHAQASLMAAVDHMCDVLKKEIQNDKEKWTASRKKARKAIAIDTEVDDTDAIAMDELKALMMERDAADEAMYAGVENAEKI